MKKLILILILFFLTGCSVEYTLTVNKDFTIEEQIKATETNRFFNMYEYSNKREVINFIFEPYFEEIDKNLYIYEIIDNDEVGGVLISRKFLSFQDYKNNTDSVKYLFKEIDYYEQGNIITLKALNFCRYNENDPERPAINKAEIIINSDFKVVEHNADKIKNNNYIWITDENIAKKEILISFDKTRRNNVINISEKIKINYSVALIILIVIGIFIFIIVVKIKEQQNNQI